LKLPALTAVSTMSAAWAEKTALALNAKAIRDFFMGDSIGLKVSTKKKVQAQYKTNQYQYELNGLCCD
jgi:hypothetical protein